jgi:hypothetical protein
MECAGPAALWIWILIERDAFDSPLNFLRQRDYFFT